MAGGKVKVWERGSVCSSACICSRILRIYVIYYLFIIIVIIIINVITVSHNNVCPFGDLTGSGRDLAWLLGV